jgi:hypothetical protein
MFSGLPGSSHLSLEPELEVRIAKVFVIHFIKHLMKIFRIMENSVLYNLYFRYTGRTDAPVAGKRGDS